MAGSHDVEGSIGIGQRWERFDGQLAGERWPELDALDRLPFDIGHMDLVSARQSV